MFKDSENSTKAVSTKTKSFFDCAVFGVAETGLFGSEGLIFVILLVYLREEGEVKELLPKRSKIIPAITQTANNPSA